MGHRTGVTQVSAVGLVTYPPGASFGPRVLRDFEFVWIIEGDAVYEADGHQTEVPAGSILLCRRGASDRFIWDSKRPTRHAYIHFQTGNIDPRWPAVADWPALRGVEDGGAMAALFSRLLRWRNAPPAVAESLVEALLGLFLMEDAPGAPLDGMVLPDAVDRAWSHLHDTLDHDPAAPLDLAGLAEVACVTPEHLCRLFKRSLGITPARAIRLGRLDRAAQLLARSNCAVGEVAELCGFATPFHFSRCFSDAFDMTPSQYRDNARRGLSSPTPRLIRRH